MKNKLPLILLVVGVEGCQQKSEVDKCVDALLMNVCMYAPSVGNEAPNNPKWNSKTCKEEMELELGAKFRLECLKAQAGKD